MENMWYNNNIALLRQAYVTGCLLLQQKVYNNVLSVCIHDFVYKSRYKLCKLFLYSKHHTVTQSHADPMILVLYNEQ